MKRAVCLLTLLLPLAGFAQLQLPGWHQTAGGGGIGHSGSLFLAGTIGQAVAAPLSVGGSASLSAGFWNPAILPPATTALGVASSENPSGYGDGIYFTASLPADATGDVVFSGPGGLNSTNPVAAGSAVSQTFSGLPRGTNLIICAYSGDYFYFPATNTLQQVVTNHPPVAAPLLLTRTAGQKLLIPLTQLAATWTDADGDPVELAAISLVSTNGARVYPLNLKTNQDGSYVITSTAYLGYLNAANVDDQLAYVIIDGQGGSSTGQVNIVVSTSSLFGQASGIVPANGQAVSLSFLGHPGYPYSVQRSTNLTSWVTVWTTNAPPAGPFDFMDTFGDLNGVAPAFAYYRLAWSP